MAKRLIETFHGRPLLDVSSYARLGPDRRDRLGPEEIALISRTVSRTPEVVVKVLTRGGQSLKAVRAHLEYLNRRGELEIETDQGERLAGDGVDSRLVKDWDLDVEACRRRSDLRPRKDGAPPKLIHKILFSMPPGSPPGTVLAAVKSFAREEFGLRHRYAMVLHTDEPHPHVHLVVKAVSEQGERLNIRKATLRRWRADFAARLRQLGVPANATERTARGAIDVRKRDEIFRAAQRGESTHVWQRTWKVEEELRAGTLRVEKGRAKLLRTRDAVSTGWHVLAERLSAEGELRLAQAVGRFVDAMPRVLTEKEAIAAHIGLARAAVKEHERSR